MNTDTATPTPTPPGLRWLYQATVDIEDAMDLGPGPRGHRYMVNITGGFFEGEGLRGRVLPGGADRQLLRPDGVKELAALYEMQTHDGAVITVDNQVVIDDPNGPNRYTRSVIRLTAPEGPYSWLNKRLVVGTLRSLKPERKAVRIDAFVVL